MRDTPIGEPLVGLPSGPNEDLSVLGRDEQEDLPDAAARVRHPAFQGCKKGPRGRRRRAKTRPPALAAQRAGVANRNKGREASIPNEGTRAHGTLLGEDGGDTPLPQLGVPTPHRSKSSVAKRSASLQLACEPLPPGHVLMRRITATPICTPTTLPPPAIFGSGAKVSGLEAGTGAQAPNI